MNEIGPDQGLCCRSYVVLTFASRVKSVIEEAFGNKSKVPGCICMARSGSSRSYIFRDGSSIERI